jgi:kynurenine formamidase
MSRIIDISMPLDNDTPVDQPGFAPKIEYQDPASNVGEMLRFFPGLRVEQLPGGEGWANETVTLRTHSGTHLDAPYHYHTTMNRGERAITIDEVPLEWCFQRGVKLDFRHLSDGYVVTPGDVRSELTRIGHELQPLDIVLINTRAGGRYGHPDYIETGIGMGRAATLYLLEQGVRVAGIDAWGWDAPFKYMAQRFSQTGDVGLIWEGHRAGMEIGYCHLEKLHNLDALPSTGFRVCCFPVKIKGGSAGWTRAVAILD